MSDTIIYVLVSMVTTYKINLIRVLRTFYSVDLVQARDMVEEGMYMPLEEVGPFITRIQAEWDTEKTRGTILSSTAPDIRFYTRQYEPPKRVSMPVRLPIL